MISVKKMLEWKPSNLFLSITPEYMVIEALEYMAEKNIGAVMVMDGDRLAGIFSERDYARKGIIKGRKAQSTPVTEVMTHNVFTVTPEMSSDDCMKMFIEKGIRHLPVMNEGKVIGMVSIRDIVNAIIEEQKTHIEFLEQYISG